jgi:hypothetical protein
MIRLRHPPRRDGRAGLMPGNEVEQRGMEDDWDWEHLRIAEHWLAAEPGAH